jgi:hypothetical protein
MEDDKREFILQVVKEMLDTDPIKRPTADDIRNRFTRQMRAASVQFPSLHSNVAPSSRDNPKASEKDSDPVPSYTRHVQPPITNESTFIRDFGMYGTNFIGRILNYIVKFFIILLIIVFPLVASVELFATSKSSSYAVTIMYGLILTVALAIYGGATDREIFHMCLRRIVVCLCICFLYTLPTEGWPELEIIQFLVGLTVTRDIIITIS